ncbi:unannotated protein [freshwater metagenome]|uniref:Unannotated protein n=1 Tax=freshwater metagenome TaxID=449393 RepID=A0A6J7FZL8_9ZZZZ
MLGQGFDHTLIRFAIDGFFLDVHDVVVVSFFNQGAARAARLDVHGDLFATHFSLQGVLSMTCRRRPRTSLGAIFIHTYSCFGAKSR